MFKTLFILFSAASLSQAATVLTPSESVQDWVDNAIAGTDIRLDFDNSSTVFSLSRVTWRVSNLFLSLRSEEVRAEKIELVGILGDAQSILIELNISDESSNPQSDGSVSYDYSGSIFFNDTQLAGLRDTDLQIIATPVPGASFDAIPEPSSLLLLCALGIPALLRQRKRI